MNQTSLMVSQSQFASQMYNVLLGQRLGKNENVVFSPFSIFFALTMVLIGARDETRTQMMKALSVGGGFSNDHVGFETWQNTVLQPFVKDFLEKTKHDDKVMAMANRLFLANDLKINREYSDFVLDTYKASVGWSDFEKDPQGEREKINQWVEGKTNQLIKNLLSPMDINSNTRMVVVNAIYFLGEWKEKFNKKFTKEKVTFRQTAEQHGSGQILVNMMTKQGTNTQYGESDGFKWVKLPYSNTNYAMTFIIPSTDELTNESERQFHNWVVEKLPNFSLQTQSIKLDTLSIPRFHMQHEESLGDILQSEPFSMTLPFSAEADFRGLTSTEEDLTISKVIHKAVIKLNEEGTEAAAATAVVVTRKAAIFKRPEDKKEFIADRPFVYVLTHEPTNTILFLGKVVSPQEE